MLPRLLALGTPCHAGAKLRHPGTTPLDAPLQHVLRSGCTTSCPHDSPPPHGCPSTYLPPRLGASALRIRHPDTCSAHFLVPLRPLLRSPPGRGPPSNTCQVPGVTCPPVLAGPSACSLPTPHIVLHGIRLFLSLQPGCEGRTAPAHSVPPPWVWNSARP